MESFIYWVLGGCKGRGFMEGREKERKGDRERGDKRKGVGGGIGCLFRRMDKEGEKGREEAPDQLVIGSGGNLALKATGYPGDRAGQHNYNYNRKHVICILNLQRDIIKRFS